MKYLIALLTAMVIIAGFCLMLDQNDNNLNRITKLESDLSDAKIKLTEARDENLTCGLELFRWKKSEVVFRKPGALNTLCWDRSVLGWLDPETPTGTAYAIGNGLPKWDTGVRNEATCDGEACCYEFEEDGHYAVTLVSGGNPNSRENWPNFAGLSAYDSPYLSWSTQGDYVASIVVHYGVISPTSLSAGR